ncbi:hypothetical protein [Sinorhizobium meliloti]|uniref:hypothetical protein n=1 Tax=Rhizobium meliloti TaxID=382 RepID=UPI00398C8668
MVDELKALDDLGFAENTIVMYSTDNGAEQFTWPDGGQSPFRGEKNTNWEGGYRYHAPCADRHDKAGHDLQRDRRSRGLDTNACAAAADPEIKGKLLAGHTVGNKTFKVHLDRYNVTNYLAGAGKDPRKEFIYFVDDGTLVALRLSLPSSGRMGTRFGRPLCATAPSEAVQSPLRSVRNSPRGGDVL